MFEGCLLRRPFLERTHQKGSWTWGADELRRSLCTLRFFLAGAAFDILYSKMLLHPKLRSTPLQHSSAAPEPIPRSRRQRAQTAPGSHEFGSRVPSGPPRLLVSKVPHSRLLHLKQYWVFVKGFNLSYHLEETRFFYYRSLLIMVT